MVNLDYLYNPAAAKPQFDKNYFVDKKLGFQVIENGTILTHADNGHGGLGGALGGIVDSDGKFIGSSFVTNNNSKGYTPHESIQHGSESVIYFGYLFPVWGHVLTDNISRVWFLKSNSRVNLKIVLLSMFLGLNVP